MRTSIGVEDHTYLKTRKLPRFKCDYAQVSTLIPDTLILDGCGLVIQNMPDASF